MIESSSGGKVKIDDLSSGKMKIQTEDGVMEINGNENGGTLKMTDKDGKVVNLDANKDGMSVKNEKGEEVMKVSGDTMTVKGDDGKNVSMTAKSGDARPDGIPADMPTLAEGTNYGWFMMGEMGSASYTVESADFKGTCSKQKALVEGAGWAAADGLSMEGTDTVIKTYAKGDQSLMVSCGLNDGKTTIGLQKSKKAA
jgi:hypothetical protein